MQSAVFFLVAFGVAFFIVRPQWIYYGHYGYLQYRVHVPQMTCFAETPAAPGDALTYLAARLAVVYHSSWGGAILIAATAWLLVVAAGGLVMLRGPSWLRTLRFLPGMTALLLYAHYIPCLADMLFITARREFRVYT